MREFAAALWWVCFAMSESRPSGELLLELLNSAAFDYVPETDDEYEEYAYVEAP